MHQTFEENDAPIKGRFVVLECQGMRQLYECQRCGCEFIKDDAGTVNSVFCWSKMDNVPKCPLCGSEGV